MAKLAVITGGTKGIGRAIIQRLAHEKFAIATCARNESDLQNLKKEINEQFPDCLIFLQPADLSEKKEVKKFSDFIRNLQIPTAILVNNAGLFIPGEIHKEEDGVLEQMMNTNLYSAYYLTRDLVAEMMLRKSGHIFNICSTASIVPYTNGGSYCISKFAMLGMTKVLRQEMKPHGIRVTAVLPGATYTDSWQGTDLPEDRFMAAEDIAETIWTAFSVSKRAVVEEILIRPQLGDI